MKLTEDCSSKWSSAGKKIWSICQINTDHALANKKSDNWSCKYSKGRWPAGLETNSSSCNSVSRPIAWNPWKNVLIVSSLARKIPVVLAKLNRTRAWLRPINLWFWPILWSLKNACEQPGQFQLQTGVWIFTSDSWNYLQEHRNPNKNC